MYKIFVFRKGRVKANYDNVRICIAVASQAGDWRHIKIYYLALSAGCLNNCIISIFKLQPDKSLLSQQIVDWFHYFYLPACRLIHFEHGCGRQNQQELLCFQARRPGSDSITFKLIKTQGNVLCYHHKVELRSILMVINQGEMEFIQQKCILKRVEQKV